MSEPITSLTSASSPVASAPAEPDALASLRSATAQAHARLDSQLPIAHPQASLADYLQHVTLIDAWLAEIDLLRGAADAWPPGWNEAQQGRRARIAADLSGVSHGPVGLAGRIDAPAQLPPGFGWGVAYVVEGSQLGGQMLYRRLHDRLAPHALHYLRGDGSSAQWPRFTAALRTAVTGSALLRGAVDGAQWAFASLTSRFERAGVVA